MRVLIAFDKFKDAILAEHACAVAARTLHEKHPEWSLDLCPLADGGDGFERTLREALGGRMVSVDTTDPLGRPIVSTFSLVPRENFPAAALALLSLPDRSIQPPTALSDPLADEIALIEMAAASGLSLLPPKLRDPWQTTTFGTGKLIRAAADFGASGIVLGLGGSATHDLGCGALSALGYEFRTGEGELVERPVPALWKDVAQVSGKLLSSVPPLRLACDVTHRLLGPQGAAATFAPQKGLPLSDVETLDKTTGTMARRLCASLEQSFSHVDEPGSGAAGGTAFGLKCAAGASIVPGFPFIAACLDLDARIERADMIITGEGRFDATSLAGKGPGSVVHRALARGKSVHVFAGQIDSAPLHGLKLHAISPSGLPLPEALRRTSELLTTAMRVL